MEHRTTTNWRDLLPVHPAAELFPPMSAEELKELADDIEKNGLRIPIELYRDTDGKVSLLDGRNRLDALALLGCQFVLPPHPDELPFDVILPNGLPLDEETEVWCVIAYADRADPYDLAIALNIKRRHLNREQKRELIAKVLAMQPDRSSRAIAAEVGVSHPTVEKIRREQVENFTTSAEPKVLNMIGAIEYNVTTKKVPLEVPVAVKNEPKTPTMIGAVDFKSTVKNVALEVPARATAVDADTGKEIEVESIPPNLVELRRGRDGKMQPVKKPKPPRKPVTQSDLRAKALEIEREAASLSEVLGARRAEPQTRDEAVVAMADLLKASRKPDDAIESMIKIAGEVRPRISTERARHLVQEFARAFGFAVEPTPISSKVLH